MRQLVMVLAMTACVRTSTVDCGDTVCAAGTTCHPIAGGEVLCVTEDQLSACDGKGEGEACDEQRGTCFNGACIPAACGNGRVDASEACDDGNVLSGDLCSADCRSTEVCGNGIVDPVRLDGETQLLNEQCDFGDTSGHDGCSATCQQETPGWAPVAAGPRARELAGLVTERTTRRSVLFGGELNKVPFNDTWELTAAGWTQLRLSLSPTPRSRMVMASDGTRTLLFGGAGGNEPLGDTWILDNRTWTPLAFAEGKAPPARFDAAMAHLPGVGFVLFGGRGKNPFADTWVFDGTTWTEHTQAMHPGERYNATFTYDPVRNRLVLAAGATTTTYVTETWEFSSTGWAQGPAMPAQRESASAAFDDVCDCIVLHGGNGPLVGPGPIGAATTRAETFTYNGAWTTHASSEPLRANASMVTEPTTGRATLFGGYDASPTSGGTFDTLFTWSEDTWQPRSYDVLTRRRNALAALDPDRQQVILYGGQAGVASLTETYVLGTASSWRERSTQSIGARNDGAACYARFAAERGVYIVGGTGGPQQTYRWVGTGWTRSTDLPQPRKGHALAFDEHRRRMVLFGGLDGSNAPTSTTWEFDGTSWTARGIAGPHPRQGHTMAYDPIRQRVLVFGGVAGNGGLYADLWSYDGTAWTEIVTPFGPTGRRNVGMAWDAARGTVVLFGGDSTGTWEWNGTTWGFVPVLSEPDPRAEVTIVSSPTGAGVLAIGGRAPGTGANEEFSDVLYFSYSSPSSAYAACRSDHDDDGDGLVGCDDPDCWAVCTPHCPPGAPCDSTAPACGDGTCDPDREVCGICGDCGSC